MKEYLIKLGQAHEFAGLQGLLGRGFCDILGPNYSFMQRSGIPQYKEAVISLHVVQRRLTRSNSHMSSIYTKKGSGAVI